MKSNFAVAYAMKKRAKMSKGGMCAHGGPIECTEGCYAKGGEVSDVEDHEEPMDDMEPLGDDDHDQMMFDEAVDPAEEDNEEAPEHFAKGGMMKKKILSKILGSISKPK